MILAYWTHKSCKWPKIIAQAVIGVISRYTEWKGIQYIIPAFKQLLNDFPNALLILANAKGGYQAAIKSQLTTHPKDSFTEILFDLGIGLLI